MQQQLINLSPDLKKLRDEGLSLAIYGGYVCIHHIPYVNEKKEVKIGTLISELTLSGGKTAKPSTHAIYFMGEKPCHKDGSEQIEIVNNSPHQALVGELIGDHFLSSKPSTGYYDNYYDKFSRYISLLSIPARSIVPDVTAYNFYPVIDSEEDTVFNYFDTSSSRANITKINEKFKGQKVGIIGLGGTGSYILDLVSKTPVTEIHLFDADDFSQHNAFRSPGAASIESLTGKQKKSEYFQRIYSNMHRGIVSHVTYVNEDNISLIKDLSFVFICVDKNSVRQEILKQLVKFEIPFIDVGLGVTLVDDQLIGIVRATTGTPQKNDHLEKRIAQEDTDQNEYVTNIQIADLNALNAVMAVIKWKKLTGFYQDLIHEHQSSYSINVGQLLNGDTTD
ncbi:MULTISPECIES: ThiF family adenylyltransferase [Mucilaginibacter]|uniref:ThiF family adenylyltransferase n=1 Tax=Mucilaginibacter defluvii TaxID=1196019 RepID=A0ABP9FXQ9_9SPHI|nr:ThiF family adenylyltransferase [Mucilaginibacter sp.]PLW91085.1 MAG: hypothetical protein C0154_03015 [Mucilaginibacter sp.]HEK21949.1 ThiF family adenylyltransferase [Bacteroidota bacterium]